MFLESKFGGQLLPAQGEVVGEALLSGGPSIVESKLPANSSTGHVGPTARMFVCI